MLSVRTFAVVLGVLSPAVAARAQSLVLPPAPAGVQTFTHEGIQFARVQAPNVLAYVPTGGNLNRPIGGGSWDFSLSRTEVTQGQYVEFVNAFNAVPIPQGQPWSAAMQTLLSGNGWAGPGVYSTGLGPQGRLINAVTPEGAVRPLKGMGWYGAALYANWLHNGRQVTMDALNNGAYDLRQWNDADPETWLSVSRQPGAQYWLPTYDEWAVASFYDASRFGPGQGGWWTYLNGRDRLPVPGAPLPGPGETSAGWSPPGGTSEAFLLPVASYPNSQSPWGQLDTSGTFPELLEDVSEFERRFAGTLAGTLTSPATLERYEQPGWAGAEAPLGGGTTAFRIASAVPAPPVAALLLSCIGWMGRRRQRETLHVHGRDPVRDPWVLVARVRAVGNLR